MKIFCIGLHKTGTFSLDKIAQNNGYLCLHSIDWDKNFKIISNYDFFSDGGSHYDNQNEIDFELLDKNFDCKFIINIRNVKSWIISKLKHAGWTNNTIIVEDKNKYLHSEWKIKSKKNIQLFIQHYFNRYIKIFQYFINKTEKAYMVNICDNQIDHFKLLLKNKNFKLVHKNKTKNTNPLSDDVLEFIDKEIQKNIKKSEKLNKLIEKFIKLKK